MSQFLYYFLLLPISRLPLRILYGLRPLIFGLLFHVVGYRKKVVIRNLKASFPEKGETEIAEITRKFYLHLCDLMLESIRLFSMPKEEILERFQIKEPEKFKPYFDKGRDVILVGGHHNNWELLAVAIDPQMDHHILGIYTPLSNAFFEEKFKASRSRLGLGLIKKNEVGEWFSADKTQPVSPIFAIDQSPRRGGRHYWTTFLNQPTAVAYGAEKYARKYNLPVIFGGIHKTKRGHYEGRFELITDEPNTLPEGEIMERATRLLESQIKAAPEFWLWTHKRWKIKPEDEVNQAS
ncbi:MAG: lysophospholipid acyltransferase family protein [Bacteroidota bacterium]